jgi:hypothetical protein
MTGSLFRDLKRANSDQRLFDDVLVYGAGRRIAWEGRTTEFPYADGVIRPGAVGWGAHLKDDTSLREIYVDRDLSRWREVSLARRSNLIGTFTPNGPSALSDVGGACRCPNQASRARAATAKETRARRSMRA